FASAMALVDQSGRQGAANYILYRLAAAQQTAGTACNASNTSSPPSTACTFNDVTSGNNSVPGETGYPNGVYSAATGYDMASGLGSVNVSNLLNNWNTVTFNPTTTTFDLNGNTTAITITHGQSVGVTAGVAPNSGSATPTGDVVLYTGLGPGTFDLFHLSAGVASGSVSDLPGDGTTPYSVWAHYGGDSTFAPSDSSQIMVTVNPEGSTTTLSLQGTSLTGAALASPFPFGSIVFVRADVAGNSGHGTATGAVTFTDTFGPIPSLNPQINPPIAVSATPPLNSQGNTSIGDGIISFDAGNHTISASYAGDSSFSSSSSTAPVSFTIQPGFAVVSWPTFVTITTVGGSGKATFGIVTSSNFTSTINITCSGLPAEATCSPTSVFGHGATTVVSASVTLTTTGPHTVMMRSTQRTSYLAILLGIGMPFGIFFIAAPRRRLGRLTPLLLLFFLMALVPSCGGSGSSGGGASQQKQDPGTPAGTYNITVTATAGSITQQGAFTLTIE